MAASNLASRKWQWLALLLLAVWTLFNLAALLKSGFISDDAYNSQIRGQIMQQGVTLNHRILEEVQGWLRGAGRLMLVTWYMTYSLYYFTQDVVVVKALTLAIIVVVIWIFYVFAKRETGSQGAALLGCMLLPCFFQFRAWHDPILAFTFLMPMTFGLTLGALVLFQRYLDGGARLLLLAGAVLYTLALLLYEIAFPLCLLFVAVAFDRERRILPAIRKSLAFTGPAAAVIAVSALFRMWFIRSSNYVQSTYPGAELHLDIGKFLSAFEIQAFSTVPLSYFFNAKDAVPLALKRGDFLALALFAATVAAVIFRLGRNGVRLRQGGWLTCGAALILLPVGLTSLSGHQAELIQVGWGYGYIPVFLQYFGLCIVLVSLVVWVAARIRPVPLLGLFAVALGVSAAAVAGANLALNRAVVAKLNETYKYPRQLVEAALKGGLADGMKDGTVVLRTMRYASDWTWLYTLASGKKLELCELSDTAAYRACLDKAGGSGSAVAGGGGIETKRFEHGEVWAVSYNFDAKTGKAGRVIAGRVDAVVRDASTQKLLQVAVHKTRIYTVADGRVHEQDFEPAINFLRVVEDESVEASQMQKLDGPRLYAADVESDWSGKMHGREGTLSANLRWSSGSGKVTLYNLTPRPQAVEIAMELATANPGESGLTVTGPAGVQALRITNVPKPFAMKLELQPGKTDIDFVSDAKPIQNGDPRSIVFGVFNYRLTPAGVPTRP